MTIQCTITAAAAEQGTSLAPTRMIGGGALGLFGLWQYLK